MAAAEQIQQSNTPVSINVRKFDPKAAQQAPEYFFDNDPFKSHFINGLSILFPEGERFFIKSVLAYRDEITDPKLLKEIKAFCAQEAQHTLVHEAMNDLAVRHGYPVEEIEVVLRRDLRNFNKLGKKNKLIKRAALATTVCMEHFTAILAYQVLTNGDNMLKNLHPSVRALFEWHAVEETEHKAVAFDVYKATGGGSLFLRVAMLWSTFFFMLGTVLNTATLLSHDGNIKKWKTHKSALSFLFGPKEGYMLKIWKDWLAFFKPGFHPWKQHRDLNTQSAIENLDSFLSRTTSAI